MNESDRPAGRAGRWMFWGFLAIAGFYLLTEHRAHLASVSWLSWLPFGILLLCPLLHMGMHGGHGGHGGQGERARNERSPLRQGTPDAPVTPSPHEHGRPGPEER